jgi:hypothetical protein
MSLKTLRIRHIGLGDISVNNDAAVLTQIYHRLRDIKKLQKRYPDAAVRCSG